MAIFSQKRTLCLSGLMTAMLVAACGPADNDPGPGGVTVGEARALDEAAEMLDERNAVLSGEETDQSIPETN